MSDIITKLDLLKDLEAVAPHLVASPRGKAGEISKNRQDLADLVARLLSDTVRPEILSWTPYQADNDSAIQVTFKGRDLIPPGWARSSLVRNNGVANSALLWGAILPGECGNNLQIVYTTDGNPVHISASGNIITVKLETGVTQAGHVITELALHGDVARMVSATNYAGSTGAGKPTPMAVANLSGGTGKRLLTPYLQTAQGADKDLLFRSRLPGVRGRLITVAYVNTHDVVPVIECGGTAVIVNYDAGVTTANAIMAAIRANANAHALVSVDLAVGNSGAGAPAAMAATHLSDYPLVWNSGWVPMLGNIPATVSATVGFDSITDDTVVVTLPIGVAPVVKEGYCFLELPTCDTVHRIPMGIKD